MKLTFYSNSFCGLGIAQGQNVCLACTQSWMWSQHFKMWGKFCVLPEFWNTQYGGCRDGSAVLTTLSENWSVHHHTCCFIVVVGIWTQVFVFLCFTESSPQSKMAFFFIFLLFFWLTYFLHSNPSPPTLLSSWSLHCALSLLSAPWRG